VTLGLFGRATAGVGIVCGLLALGLDIGGGGRYVADGTTFAFLVITLSLASHFPAEIASDARGAALGAAAFGFFLFIPAVLAFDKLGYLRAAGWLGVCTALVPLGYVIVRMAEGGHSGTARSLSRHAHRDPFLLVTTAGVALIVVGVWFKTGSGGPSYWDASHTLGILMLLLAALNVLLAVGAPASSDAALLVAATTFGLVEFGWIESAFTSLGSLGTGGWLEAIGGLFLIVGIVAARRAAAPAAATAPSPVAAQ
jgi:hypothetical protein